MLCSNGCRWSILLLICVVRFLTIIPLDIPVGLTDTTIRVLNIGVTQYNLLWFVSAWPSTVLSVVGGLLTDKVFGLRIGLLVFVCTVLLGQFVWSLGTFFNLFWLILIGRFFIGAGYNTLTVASHGLKAVWFKGILSTAMGFDNCFAGLGDTLAIILPQILYNNFIFISNPLYRIGTILLIVAVGILLALIFTIIIVIMDWKGKSHPHRVETDDHGMNCKDLKNFTPIVWLVISTAALYFAIVYSFIAISQLLFIHQFGLTSDLANIANAIVLSASIPLTPVMGLIIDATGYHLFWSMCGIVLSIVAQFLILLSSGQQFIPFVVGAIYSLSILICNASLRPAIALLIEVNQVATAFGLFKGLNNVILLLLYVISGVLIDGSGYFILMLLFIIFSIVSLLMVGVLCVADHTGSTNMINISGKELRKRLQETLIKDQSQETKNE